MRTFIPERHEEFRRDSANQNSPHCGRQAGADTGFETITTIALETWKTFKKSSNQFD